MTKENIELLVNERIDEMIDHAEIISDDFNIDVIQHFKENFKLIRQLANFIKMHNGNKDIKSVDKCKEIYNTTGAIREAKVELQLLKDIGDNVDEKTERYSEMLEGAQNDWNKNYSKNNFIRIKKELVDFNYRVIRDELLDNFFLNTFKLTEKKNVTIL